jgi:hypothetical protein
MASILVNFDISAIVKIVLEVDFQWQYAYLWQKLGEMNMFPDHFPLSEEENYQKLRQEY